MKLLAGILSVSSIISLSLNSASPASQPVYPAGQYVSAQSIPIQYSQQQQIPQGSYVQQPQYISVQAAGHVQQEPTRPVFENAERGAASDAAAGLVQQQLRYSTQIKQPIQQVLVATNVDRQIQRAAHLGGGPLYLQQVQAAQQQGQAQEVIRVAQSKATSQTLNRQLRPIPQQPQPQPQPQYLHDLTPQFRYARPVSVQYRPQHSLGPQQQQQQQQQHHQQQSQNPETGSEDYDPNPSYQFGFDVNDDVYTNYQNRKEQREGNKITGSYSVVDSDGFVRTVKYTADPKEGFKAEVTRQPTDIVVKIPKPDPQYLRQQHQQYVQEVPAEQKAHQVQSQQRPNVIYQYQ